MAPSIHVFTSSSAAAWPTALMALKSPLPSPNVIVPKQNLETTRPVLPSVAYSMVFSFCELPLGSFMHEQVLTHESGKKSPGDSVPERIKPSLRIALCLCRLTGDEIYRRISDRTHDRRHE